MNIVTAQELVVKKEQQRSKAARETCARLEHDEDQWHPNVSRTDLAKVANIDKSTVTKKMNLTLQGKGVRDSSYISPRRSFIWNGVEFKPNSALESLFRAIEYLGDTRFHELELGKPEGDLEPRYQLVIKKARRLSKGVHISDADGCTKFLSNSELGALLGIVRTMEDDKYEFRTRASSNLLLRLIAVVECEYFKYADSAAVEWGMEKVETHCAMVRPLMNSQYRPYHENYAAMVRMGLAARLGDKKKVEAGLKAMTASTRLDRGVTYGDEKSEFINNSWSAVGLALPVNPEAAHRAADELNLQRVEAKLTHQENEFYKASVSYVPDSAWQNLKKHHLLPCGVGRLFWMLMFALGLGFALLGLSKASVSEKQAGGQARVKQPVEMAQPAQVVMSDRGGGREI